MCSWPSRWAPVLLLTEVAGITRVLPLPLPLHRTPCSLPFLPLLLFGLISDSTGCPGESLKHAAEGWLGTAPPGQAEIGEPLELHPDCGRISIQVELSACASPEFQVGAPANVPVFLSAADVRWHFPVPRAAGPRILARSSRRLSRGASRLETTGEVRPKVVVMGGGWELGAANAQVQSASSFQTATTAAAEAGQEGRGGSNSSLSSRIRWFRISGRGQGHWELLGFPLYRPTSSTIPTPPCLAARSPRLWGPLHYPWPSVLGASRRWPGAQRRRFRPGRPQHGDAGWPPPSLPSKSYTFHADCLPFGAPSTSQAHRRSDYQTSAFVCVPATAAMYSFSSVLTRLRRRASGSACGRQHPVGQGVAGERGQPPLPQAHDLVSPAETDRIRSGAPAVSAFVAEPLLQGSKIFPLAALPAPPFPKESFPGCASPVVSR